MLIQDRQEYEKITTTLLNAVTANTQSNTFPFSSREKTIEAFITGTGAVGATVTVYGCNTRRTANGIPLATLVLSGTASDQAGSILTFNWPYIYVVLSGITGTGAAVTFTVSQ